MDVLDTLEGWMSNGRTDSGARTNISYQVKKNLITLVIELSDRNGLNDSEAIHNSPPDRPYTSHTGCQRLGRVKSCAQNRC